MYDIFKDLVGRDAIIPHTGLDTKGSVMHMAHIGETMK